MSTPDKSLMSILKSPIPVPTGMLLLWALAVAACATSITLTLVTPPGYRSLMAPLLAILGVAGIVATAYTIKKSRNE